MENPLVLVIDDSQTIRKMVECHLSQDGYRVALAADAERGLEMARTLQPDLILLDHQLPGTTGDEVCRKGHPVAGLRQVAFDHLANGLAVVDHKNQGVFHDFSEICDRPGSAASGCKQRADGLGQCGRIHRLGKEGPGSQSQNPPPGFLVQLRARGDHGN